MNTLTRQASHWERLASDDPMWVILTCPGRERGGWTEDEFFATGRAEIAEIMAMLAGRDIDVARRVALDFGCGIGRLTQALADHFDRVVGIDISERMIEMARAWNRFGARVEYVANATDALPMIPDGSVDFVYSYITLQHIPRRAAERYVTEFARVLAPGGVAIFQALTRARHWAVRARHHLRDLAPDAYRWLRDLVSRRARWEINILGEPAVRRALGRYGVDIRFAYSDNAAGETMESRRFIAVKPAVVSATPVHFHRDAGPTSL